MGLLTITTRGSFKPQVATFSAMKHAHAQAVAGAIRWLSEVVLPEAIEQDHRLHKEGSAPEDGLFGAGETRV